MHVSGWELFAVHVVLLCGGCLQGSIGFGMAVVALPFLIVIEPALLPQSMLLASMPFAILMALRTWGDCEWRDVVFISLARMPGTLVAVWLLGILSQDFIALTAAILVIAAVIISIRAPAINRTMPVLGIAGFVSGLFTATAAIGGPPIALIFQHETGAKIRSTMSFMAVISLTFTVLILSVGGQLDGTDLRTGLSIAPAPLVGLYLSRFLIPYSDQRLRTFVLVICAAAAVAAIGKLVLL